MRLEHTTMAYRVRKLNGDKRARQKQASRDKDAKRLRSGRVSRLELQAENGFFRGIDLSAFHIVAIGGRSIEAVGTPR